MSESEKIWFIAEATFQVLVKHESRDAPLFRERLLFLVSDVDSTAAMDKAQSLARAKEHSYRNGDGQLVQWQFVELVDVKEMVDQRFEDGAELRSHLED